MKKIIYFLFFCFICISLNSQNYYISSSTGDDRNDGLTESTAWKTLAKVKISKNLFVPGTVIGFKKGDIWKEQLVLEDLSGTLQKPIIFTSYGIGEKPVISAVDIYKGTWENIGSNRWRSQERSVPNNRLKVNGEEVLTTVVYNELGTSVPDLIQAYWGTINGSKKYIYLYSSTDPSFKIVEIQSFERALYIINCKFLNFENIEFEGGYGQGVTVFKSSNLNFVNLKIGVMSYDGFSIGSRSPNDYCNNINIKNCLFDTEYVLNYSNAIKNNTTSYQRGGQDGLRFYSCNGGDITNNIFKNWGHSNLSATTRDKSIITNIKIYKNTFTSPDICYGVGLGLDGAGTYNIEVYNNYFFKTRDAQINGHNNHIHHNIFEDIRTTPLRSYQTGHGIGIQNYYEGSYSNIYENNIFIRTAGAAFYVLANDPYDISKHIIRNNIIFECGFAYNNIALRLYDGAGADPTNSNTFQNNLIYNSSTNRTIKYYLTDITVSDFNKRNGDAHGNTISGNIDANPLFVGSSDYHLQKDSPAINAGVAPTSIKDFEGNSVPFENSKPDIGIYEHFISQANNSTLPPATVTADAGADQAICAGSSATITASGGSVYKWSTGATTKSITVSPGATTTYSVTVSEGSVSDTDEVVVTVNEVPIADAGTDVTIESGQSTTLTATGGDTYQWSNGATTASISVNPTVTTTYEVTVNKNGCSSKDAVTVTVNTASAPPATVTADAGADQAICAGSSATLTASGGSVYKWSTGATTKSITVSPGVTTTYSVTVSEGSVSDTDEVLVTINPLPIADAGSNKTIELGQSVELTATGGNTYLWSTGETTQSITVKPDKSTIYSVTVNQNGCSSGDSVQVTVNVPPPADANAGSDLTICKGESITLNGDGGATYSWSTGATTRNITVSPNRTTTYTLTANRGGTTSTDEVIVTVINCNLNNGVNNSVSGTTGNTATTDPTDQDDAQVLNKADFELTVYPNPTEGKLNVQTTVPIYNFNLVLMNINGNVIYSDEMDAAEDGINKEIDLSGFAKGVYLLQLYNAEESYVKKVIVI